MPKEQTTPPLTPEEQAEVARLVEQIGGRRQHSDSAFVELKARAQGERPGGNLPGYEVRFFQELMGSIEGSLRKIDSRQQDEAEERGGSLGIETHAQPPRELTIRERSLSPRKDDQRVQIIHRVETRMGQHIQREIQIKAKRYPKSLQREVTGSLQELYIRDQIGGGFFGIDIRFNNPSVDSAQPKNHLMVFDRLRLLRAPENFEEIQAAIVEHNRHLRENPERGQAVSEIGDWHDFMFWQPEHNPRNPFSVAFDSYSIPWEEFQTKSTIGAPIIFEGPLAQVVTRMLPEKTTNDDPVLEVGIYPNEAIKADHPIPKAPISFHLPAFMTIGR